MHTIELSEKIVNNMILDFLKENGFSENAVIKKSTNKRGKPIVDSLNRPIYTIVEYIRYQEGFVPKITPITNYYKLLLDVLHENGVSIDYISTKLKGKDLYYFLVSEGPINFKSKGAKSR